MNEGTPLYEVTMHVTYAPGYGEGNQTVHVAAQDLEEATEKAEPLTGHASYDLLSVRRIGRVIV